MKRAALSGNATVEDLARELARIQTLNTSELRSLVLATTGEPPSREISGDLLRRKVSHRLQTQELGGLNPKIAKLLHRLADGGGEGARRLMPGSVLTRELNGTLHQVMVVEDGFMWQGRIYPSLSAVAKAMTGTSWNGHRFFGLKTSAGSDAKRPKSKRRGGSAEGRSDSGLVAAP